MKISCELCRKVFKVNANKLTSLGITVYCPRCKHPHLVKRVVQPHPINKDFQVSSPDKGDRHIRGEKASSHIDPSGMMHIDFKEGGDGAAAVDPKKQPKAKYNWRGWLKFKRREKRAKSARELMKKGSSAWQFIVRVLSLSMGMGLVCGALYFKSLPKAEQDIYMEKLRPHFQRLFDLVERLKARQ